MNLHCRNTHYTPTRRSLKYVQSSPLTLACCLCVAILSFPCFIEDAYSVPPGVLSTKTAVEKGIDTYRINIRRLQRGIQSQKDKTEESRQEERNVLLELEEISTKLQAQQDKVAGLESKVAEQEQLIEFKEQEITDLQSEKEGVLKHLKRRITAYYRMGKVGFFNVAFSTSSLPELLKFHDAFQTLILYDQKVLSSFREKIDNLERARNAYQLEKGLLQEFVENSLTEKEETDRIHAEKEKLLVHIRTQKQLYQRAITEMEEATEQLSESLIALKTSEKSSEQTFKRAKGKLPPPVKGKVITRFNEENTNKLGIKRKSAGISISAPDGTQVEAIATGEIIFSGYLRGYGNTVIIHHGFQYYTVTSRLEKNLLQKGDSVEAGTYIGQMSDTATLFDEGLYFEIRHGKESQDPLQWLNISK